MSHFQRVIAAIEVANELEDSRFQRDLATKSYRQALRTRRPAYRGERISEEQLVQLWNEKQTAIDAAYAASVGDSPTQPS